MEAFTAIGDGAEDGAARSIDCKGTGALGEAKVLDSAAGYGLFGIGIAQHNPDAKMVVAD